MHRLARLLAIAALTVTTVSYAATTSHISAGAAHSAVIDSSGKLWAWGANTLGQLGNGTTSNNRVPVLIGEGFAQVSAGANHTLAIKPNGSLWAWGNNAYGQLGNGNFTSSTVPVLVGNGFRQAAAAKYFSVALKTDGSLWTWGNNEVGSLGNGTRATCSVTTTNSCPDDAYSGASQPTQIGTGYSAISANSGAFHVLALKPDGSLWAWGLGESGQIGNNSTLNALAPVQVGSGFSTISAGRSSSFAIKADGTLWAWGSNSSSQLGSGTAKSSEPLPVLVGSGYSQVSAGGITGVEGIALPFGNTHTLALKTDGTLWAWGQNTYGQLGDGTTATRSTPVQVGTGFARISAGGLHSLAAKVDGTLYAWGSNALAQTGLGTITTTSVLNATQFYPYPQSVVLGDSVSSPIGVSGLTITRQSAPGQPLSGVFTVTGTNLKMVRVHAGSSASSGSGPVSGCYLDLTTEAGKKNFVFNGNWQEGDSQNCSSLIPANGASTEIVFKVEVRDAFNNLPNNDSLPQIVAYYVASAIISLPEFDVNISISLRSDSSRIIRWDLPPAKWGMPAPKFEFYRSVKKGTEGELLSITDGQIAVDESILPTGVPGYFYLVKACNAAGCVTSTQVEYKPSPQTGFPIFMSGVEITPSSSYGLMLRWNAAAGIVSRYELYQSTYPGQLGSPVYTGSNLSFLDFMVVKDKTYYYVVKACNVVGCTTGTQDFFHYAANPISAPTISVTNNGRVSPLSNVTISVNQPTNGQSYILYFRRADELWSLERTIKMTSPSLSFSMPEGIDHYISARAIVGDIESAFSNEVRLISVNTSPWITGSINPEAEQPLVLNNKPPRYSSRISRSTPIKPGGTVTILATATDADGDEVKHHWVFKHGRARALDPRNLSIEWEAPLTEGLYLVNGYVTDGKGGIDGKYFLIRVKN